MKSEILQKLYLGKESVNPGRCIAYAVRQSKSDEIVGVIELTAQLHNELYQIVNFYVYEDYAHNGVGGYLLNTAEREVLNMGIHKITVEPTSLYFEGLPDITQEERICIYEHLGFTMKQENTMEKEI